MIVACVFYLMHAGYDSNPSGGLTIDATVPVGLPAGLLTHHVDHLPNHHPATVQQVHSTARGEAPAHARTAAISRIIWQDESMMMQDAHTMCDILHVHTHAETLARIFVCEVSQHDHGFLSLKGTCCVVIPYV